MTLVKEGSLSWLKQNYSKGIVSALIGGALVFLLINLSKDIGTVAVLKGESCVANLYVSWVSYSKPDYKDIKAGDLLAFDGSAVPGYKKGDIIVKFVKAKEGDSVQVSNSRGGVFINDVFLSSSFYHATTPIEAKGKVPPNKLFMLGNTHNSFDSRYFGPIDYDKVIGRAYEIF